MSQGFVNGPLILSSNPSGTVIQFAGTLAPDGYLQCDGAAVSRTTYAVLFAAISTTWGVGDGVTTFNLPSLSRRTLAGSGGTGSGTLGNAVGNTGGAETHTLLTAEMPAHTHGIGWPNAATSTGGTVNGVNAAITQQSSSTGGGGAHNNIQPTAIVLMCIKT